MKHLRERLEYCTCAVCRQGRGLYHTDPYFGECDDCRNYNYLHKVREYHGGIRYVCIGCKEEYLYSSDKRRGARA